MNDDEEGSIWDEEVKQPRSQHELDFYYWDGCQMASDGFPTDDEYSLIQGDHSGASLDIYYANQFVQGERHNWKDWKGKKGTIDLIVVHTPIIKGSLIGFVLDDDKRIAAFHFTEGGVLLPAAYKSWDIELEKSTKIINSGSLDEVTGELSLTCNLDKFDLVLDYEYNMG